MFIEGMIVGAVATGALFAGIKVIKHRRARKAAQKADMNAYANTNQHHGFTL
jgi:hypothetical protein